MATQPVDIGRLRRLPYGANYLRWEDMRELQEAVRGQILFRYQTEGESRADRLEALARARFGVAHALGCHNCTEGLRLSLLATRPRVGDLVHIPAMTFVAVAGAALSCGLVPVPVDLDADLSLDPERLPADAERVIVAHMEGTVGRLPERVPHVIEDAAQALGARHPDGRAVGAVGFTGVFSFHHNKVLTSGEGGLVLTGSAAAYEAMRRYHDHGADRVQGEYPRWRPDTFYGENCVTSEAVAAIQLQQFRHLDALLAGAERGYRHLLEVMSGVRGLTVRPRRAGDVKISLRVEFPRADLRGRAVEALLGRRLPHWTLDKYFLPTHPVLAGRRSIYGDGFPWNLAPRDLPRPEAFAETRDRIARTLCLTVSPELDGAAQRAEAEAYAVALGGL